MRSLRPRTIRMRLTLWYAAALALGLLVYGGLVFSIVWRTLSHDLNLQLAQDIEMTEAKLELVGGKLAWKDASNPDEAAEIPRVAVYDKAGQMLYESPRFKNSSDTDYRSRKETEHIEGLAPVSIRALRSTRTMDHQLLSLALILGLGIPVGTGLMALGGFALARRALAPVERMTAKARAMTAEGLSSRLAVENPDDELGRLAAVFNDVFSRLENSFAQLSRFTADASHELRTPLAAMRSVGEVGVAQPRNAPEYREIIGSMLEEVDRLTRTVDTLLTISRADGGQVRLSYETVDLTALARELTQHLGVLAEEKKQTIVLNAPPSLPAQADRAVLRQALTNLIDNAVKYSAEHAAIRIDVRREGPRAVIEVADEGPGIAPEHIEKIFERFYRVDKARSREMGGTGLGLAITRWAIEAHGGEIRARSVSGQGSVFSISIPLEREIAAP